ncbi:M48 family metallopeptidase [bacterium]|nr:M48 family metallopeptidase [bacterium]
MRKISLLALFAAALFLQACYTVPVTGRSAFIMTSVAEEKALGLEAYNAYKTNAVVLNDYAINNRIRTIGQRIAKIAESDTQGMDWEWEFVVFDDSQTANAWCLPGGKVAVYTGILPYAKNDAQLATVMAHEIGHAVARHGVERMGTETAVSVIGSVIGSSVSDANAEAVMAAYGVGSSLMVTLPFSRDDEYEADQIGMNYMARAGYDPNEAIKFWENFMEAGGSSVPELLSTHPSDANRIAKLKTYLPANEELYKKATGK